MKGAINTINHLPEQSSSFLLHNVFALLSGSGGSFRGDSFSHRYPHVRGGHVRGRSGRHRFLGRGQWRGHRPHPKNLTHKSPKEHVDQVSANILNIAGRISNYTLENRKYKYTCYFANITGKMEYGYCPKFKRGDNSTYTFTKRGAVYLWRPLDVCSWLVYFGDGMLSP